MAEKSQYTIKEINIRDSVYNRTGTYADINFFGDEETEEDKKKDRQKLSRLMLIINKEDN